MMIADVPLTMTEAAEKSIPAWPQWAVYMPYHHTVGCYYTIFHQHLYEVRYVSASDQLESVFDRQALGSIVDDLIGNLVPSSALLTQLPDLPDGAATVLHHHTELTDPVAKAAELRALLPGLV